MDKGRLEAFSDGVLAIIITIMVLEMKVPLPHQGATLADLKPVLPYFLSYALSYVFIGIYWNNHHHLFQATERVTGATLWANLHLLFWLSLIPFTTAWTGQNNFAPTPTALYASCRDRLLHSAAHDSLGSGRQSGTRGGPGQRLEGQTFAPHLLGRDRILPCQPVDRLRALRSGRTDLADPRSAHRADVW